MATNWYSSHDALKLSAPLIDEDETVRANHPLPLGVILVPASQPVIVPLAWSCSFRNSTTLYMFPPVALTWMVTWLGVQLP